jgi:hypothetical protein
LKQNFQTLSLFKKPNVHKNHLDLSVRKEESRRKKENWKCKKVDSSYAIPLSTEVNLAAKALASPPLIRIFFSILAFFNHISNHVNPSDVIYTGVASCALAWLMGLTRAQPMTWHHLGVSRVICCGTTRGPAAMPHVSTSRVRVGGATMSHARVYTSYMLALSFQIQFIMQWFIDTFVMVNM